MLVALEDNLCLKWEERQIHLQEGGKNGICLKTTFWFKKLI